MVFTIWFFKVFVINQDFEKATKSGFNAFLIIHYCWVCSFVVAGCSLLHFLPATVSHPTVIDLLCVPTLNSIIFAPIMASLHSSANNLLHPTHHDGSQLLPDDDSDNVPGSDVDKDNIIVVNPPDINVVDAPVVGV